MKPFFKNSYLTTFFASLISHLTFATCHRAVDGTALHPMDTAIHLVNLSPGTNSKGAGTPADDPKKSTEMSSVANTTTKSAMTF